MAFSNQPPVRIEPRPASWGELATAFVVGVAVTVLAFVLFYPTCVLAGGAVDVTWSQSADCAIVTGWDVLIAPITTQQPNPQPTAAAIGVSIANTGTPACGLNMQKRVTVSDGVGPTRFWIRAVAPQAFSKPSNPADASVPLAPPAGLSIAVP